MLFRTKPAGERPAPLKPFVFRVREGFLIGLAMDPQEGAPCAGCVEKWLNERELWAERVSDNELPIRRDLFDELVTANNAHTYYEIARDGSATKLECAVFPHPDCVCNKSVYVAPEKLTRRTNFSFSPILQISSERHGTPKGNLWVTSAAGPSLLCRQPVSALGSGLDKETSRFRAVDSWMRQASAADAEWRQKEGERLEIAQLQTGRDEAGRELTVAGRTVERIGVGHDREEATLEALMALTLKQTLKRYGNSAKNPMLIVGANNWLRERVPFFLLQRYDLHLLFYPNSTPCWNVGLAAFSRLRADEKPIFVFAADTSILVSLEKTLGKILEACPPSLNTGVSEDYAPNGAKLNLWWTHWIYRCPKISLSDILHLEPYSRNLEPWLGYWRDGQPTVTVTALNHPSLPTSLRTIVRVRTTDLNAPSNVRSLHGIGTWSHFQESLN